MSFERVCRPVIAGVEHGIDRQHRDLASAPVLPELCVVDGAMMIHYVKRASVLARDKIGGVSERSSVQPVERHLAAADNGVGCQLVCRFQCVGKRNRVKVGQSPACNQDVRVAALRRDGAGKKTSRSHSVLSRSLIRRWATITDRELRFGSCGK